MEEVNTQPTEESKAVGQQNVSTFAAHKERTAKDCEQAAEMLIALARDVREGNMKAFEQFWMEGGTEEGDAKIHMMREILIIRYLAREEKLQGHTAEPNGAEPEVPVVEIGSDDGAGCPALSSSQARWI